MRHFGFPHFSKEFRKEFEILGGIAVTLVAAYFLMEALKGLDISDILDAGIHWPLACLSAILFDMATLVRSFAYPYGIKPEMSVMEAW